MRAHESSKWRFGQEIRSIRSVRAMNAPWPAEVPVLQGQTGFLSVRQTGAKGPRRGALRRPPKARCGNGIRITAPGRAMTARQPRAMNIAVIPKSHSQGVLDAGHDKLTTSYPLWTLDNETVTRLAAQAAADDADSADGATVPTEPIVSASSSPPATHVSRQFGARIAAEQNPVPAQDCLSDALCHITKFTRPEWIAHRDFTPIKLCTLRACLRSPDCCGIEFRIFALRKAKHYSLHCSECILIFSLRHFELRPCICRTLFVLSICPAVFGGEHISTTVTPQEKLSI